MRHARPELTDVDKEIVNMIDYLSGRYNGCKIIHFVVMLNHIQLLIQIRGRASPSPTVGNIVCGLKSGVSRIVGFSPWQCSFHAHVIRDDEYNRITEYIQNNSASELKTEN